MSVSVCRKSMFFQKSACSQPLSPNPFPRERGYITGATAPSPCRGLRPCDPIFINDRGFSVYCLSNLMSNHLSRYFVCKRYAKICGDVFGRKTAQLPKMSFAIVKNAMRVQDELHNLPIWVMSFCQMRCKI